jgi:hypothetical protein
MFWEVIVFATSSRRRWPTLRLPQPINNQSCDGQCSGFDSRSYEG